MCRKAVFSDSALVRTPSVKNKQTNKNNPAIPETREAFFHFVLISKVGHLTQCPPARCRPATLIKHPLARHIAEHANVQCSVQVAFRDEGALLTPDNTNFMTRCYTVHVFAVS